MRTVGMTLPAYIARKRMEKAKELLEYPDIKDRKKSPCASATQFLLLLQKRFMSIPGYPERVADVSSEQDGGRPEGKQKDR